MNINCLTVNAHICMEYTNQEKATFYCSRKVQIDYFSVP